MKSEALLAGRIFDGRGNRMSPSHARKRGIKYRYYLSTALIQGRVERAESIRRVPRSSCVMIYRGLRGGGRTPSRTRLHSLIPC